ncbi:MAG TPA: hypothetical protein VIC59_10115 [Gemmatimonadota bacterium]|jgi:hypothetical protein
MTRHILFLLALLSASTLFALAEIQIEGRHGWASRLPTWRFESPWTRRLLGARAVTGYHLYVQLFMLVALHLPYGLGLARPSLAAELRILSFLLLFWVVQDFLWFVLNPSFGIRRFDARHAWWHAPNWWWIMPRDYWLFTPLGLLLYMLSWGR